MPPPPADALIAIGQPSSSPSLRTSSADSTGRVDARDDRDARRLHPLTRLDLGSHRLDRLGRRADPHESPASLARAREGRVLGEEAVAGMDRLRAGPSRGVENPFLVQIALGGRAGADQVRLVGIGHVRRIPVDVRIDGDRADAELAQRPEDADRDLAPVGDEHLC